MRTCSRIWRSRARRRSRARDPRRTGRSTRPGDDPTEAPAARLLTPVAKFWICKRAPPLSAEAMECLGGNGYVEEALLARLYREAPLNGIWEGAGNVICLDVVRVIRREPQVRDALRGEIRRRGLGRAQRAVERNRRSDRPSDRRRTRRKVAGRTDSDCGAILPAIAPCAGLRVGQFSGEQDRPAAFDDGIAGSPTPLSAASSNARR